MAGVKGQLARTSAPGLKSRRPAPHDGLATPQPAGGGLCGLPGFRGGSARAATAAARCYQAHTVLVARSDTGVLANTEHFSAWKKEFYIPGADDPRARKSRDLGAFMVPLAALCPVPGQDGTLLRRAMASLAPPSPSVKKSESIAPHFLRRGPPSSDGRIWPAGASGKGRALQIGYKALLPW